MTNTSPTQPSNLIQQYMVITSSYWTFTITDGALRMLVVLYFYGLGYSALNIALLFLLYEFFGVVTNLFGGWLGARLGLNSTLYLGLSLQIIALGMLAVDSAWLSIAYVMAAQALSGIAKDLNKMSAKSAVKFLVSEDAQQNKLYRWVAFLTGSKNALKGFGFFLGGLLLAWLGFQMAMLVMLAALVLVLALTFILLKQDLGKSKNKPKIQQLLSKSPAINRLSAARLFLFGARDVWFVVALPVYFQQYLHWTHTQVGTFMALWVIGYGVVQAFAPHITGKQPQNKTALTWVLPLALIPLLIASAMSMDMVHAELYVVGGLLLFGGVFAINSSLHSFLILRFARHDGVSLDVGFYYMANASGRLLGTLLSGLIYQWQGLESCLVFSAAFLLLAAVFSFWLSKVAAD